MTCPLRVVVLMALFCSALGSSKVESGVIGIPGQTSQDFPEAEIVFPNQFIDLTLSSSCEVKPKELFISSVNFPSIGRTQAIVEFRMDSSHLVSGVRANLTLLSALDSSEQLNLSDLELEPSVSASRNLAIFLPLGELLQFFRTLLRQNADAIVRVSVPSRSQCYWGVVKVRSCIQNSETNCQSSTVIGNAGSGDLQSARVSDFQSPVSPDQVAIPEASPNIFHSMQGAGCALSAHRVSSLSVLILLYFTTALTLGLRVRFRKQGNKQRL